MTTRTRYKDDSGAALVIVMIIITVVALVTGALLSQADTSMKATIALRDQAGSAYNGDGAAQAAINELRKGTYNNVTNTQCFGGTGTLALPGFYPATYGQTGTAKGSASVTCAAETGTGAQGSPVPISDKNKPGNAVLTLGTAANDGQVYGQSNQDLNIRGGIISNATIDSTKAKLNLLGGATVSAVGACTGPITPACTTLATPLADPNYPAPTDSPAPPSMPACNNKNTVAEFRPGLYRDADFLTNCKASWMLFDTGTYYFDFTSTNKVWTVDGTVVGGTVPGLTAGSVLAGAQAPSVPGACVNPIIDITAVGVQFAFGGSSQVSFAKNSNFEVCASYASSAVPPIPTVVYGLKSDIGTGANLVHAQSGCVIDPVASCELFSDGANGVKPTFFFQGLVYAPRASVDIAVNNTTKPYFNWGVVLRRLNLTTTGSPGSAPIISLPDNSLGYGTASTIVDLTVYVCPGVTMTTCSTNSSRRLQLTARVQITDPSGSPVAGQRQMTVLSWGMRR
jgi:hypothetical protein